MWKLYKYVVGQLSSRTLLSYHVPYGTTYYYDVVGYSSSDVFSGALQV